MPCLTIIVPSMEPDLMAEWAESALMGAINSAPEDLTLIALIFDQSLDVFELIRCIRELPIRLTIDLSLSEQTLYVVMPGGRLKSEIELSLALQFRARFPEGDSGATPICLRKAGNMYIEREVNVGCWLKRPSLEQWQHPVKNRIPIPDLWIEVFYHDDSADRKRVLNKPEDVRTQSQNSDCEFCCIGLPDVSRSPQLKQMLQIAARSIQPAHQNVCPNMGPYIAHWIPWQPAPIFYKITNPNEVLHVLREKFQIRFGDILEVFLGHKTAMEFVIQEQTGQLQQKIVQQQQKIQLLQQQNLQRQQDIQLLQQQLQQIKQHL